MLGAEAFGGSGEAGRGLLQHFTNHQNAPERVTDLDVGDLLSHACVRRVGTFARHQVQRPVRHEAIDAATLVLQLAHRLFERRTFGAHQVLHRHAHVGVEHLAEVAVGGHVGDRPHFDAGGVHRHDDFADAGVRWACFAGAADQVTEVGEFAEARPDFLSVDHPLVAVAHGRGGQRGEVAAGVGLAHADAPRGVAAQHVGQEAFLLFARAVAEQGRAHLPVGEPHARYRRAGGDHFFADDQSVDGRAPAAAVFAWPGHADEAFAAQFARKFLRVTVHPAVVRPAVSRDGVSGEFAGAFSQQHLLAAPRKVHRQVGYLRAKDKGKHSGRRP